MCNIYFKISCAINIKISIIYLNVTFCFKKKDINTIVKKYSRTILKTGKLNQMACNLWPRKFINRTVRLLNILFISNMFNFDSLGICKNKCQIRFKASKTQTMNPQNISSILYPWYEPLVLICVINRYKYLSIVLFYTSIPIEHSQHNVACCNILIFSFF